MTAKRFHSARARLLSAARCAPRVTRWGKGTQFPPAAGSWLSKTADIELDRTRRVRILVEPGGELLEVTTVAQTAAGIMEQAGITPASKDTVRVNGLKVGLDDPLSQGGSLVIEYRPVLTLRISIDGEERTITSSAANLAAALWQEGIVLRGGDRISPRSITPLMENMEIVITTGRPITISVDGTSVEGYSAADTVGVALADAVNVAGSWITASLARQNRYRRTDSSGW